MDEIELRLAAVELTLMKVIAELPPELVGRVRARIKACLEHACDGDEAAIRKGAMDLIADGLQREELWRPGQVSAA